MFYLCKAKQFSHPISKLYGLESAYAACIRLKQVQNSMDIIFWSLEAFYTNILLSQWKFCNQPSSIVALNEWSLFRRQKLAE